MSSTLSICLAFAMAAHAEEEAESAKDNTELKASPLDKDIPESSPLRLCWMSKEIRFATKNAKRLDFYYSGFCRNARYELRHQHIDIVRNMADSYTCEVANVADQVAKVEEHDQPGPKLAEPVSIAPVGLASQTGTSLAADGGYSWLINRGGGLITVDVQDPSGQTLTTNQVPDGAPINTEIKAAKKQIACYPSHVPPFAFLAESTKLELLLDDEQILKINPEILKQFRDLQLEDMSRY
ncbi:MAG: hypothetical protein C5B49_15715 [Bdellovibrio sp.]|nr:MAG: hypothetical protein C5B49_15715 [Bdellovibrio sp.]